MIFSHPEPQWSRPRILPVFMPFSGCKNRCVFCSQTLQTGKAETALERVYQGLEESLQSLPEHAGFEVAFYGGTFTAIPFAWQEKFVRLAGRYRDTGQVTAVRCSTRPDAVQEDSLIKLRALGLRTVELGVQSFNNTVLSNSKRGYTQDVIVSACNLVRKCGLSLGIQLLPGLPGMDEKIFQNDIAQTCLVRPDIVRLYPCLVLNNTVLSKWYRDGTYAPWSESDTVARLGQGLLSLWQHDIRVIRIGVAQEQGLRENIVAGPFHEAMGSMVRSEALRIFLTDTLEQMETLPRLLIIPSRYRGELWGHKGIHKSHWNKYSITPERVCWWKLPVFQLD